MGGVIKLLEAINKCDLPTKIILLVLLVFTFIIIMSFISFIKNNNFNLIKFINKIVYIFKHYEIRTVAGIINMSLSFILLFCTVLTFISKSILEIMGINSDSTILKIILIIATILGTFICLGIMSSFDKTKNILTK